MQSERVILEGEEMSRVDCFAELLSRDLPMEAIRDAMGLSRHQANGMMRRLREKAGEQAQ